MYDYGKENEEREKKEKEQTLTDFWRSEEGRFKVTILSDPKEVPDRFSDDKDAKRIQLQVNVDGKDLTWEFSKSIGAKGIWGQLTRLGSGMQKEGKELKGSIITVRVKGKDKDKSYDIDELYDYLKREEPSAPSSNSSDDVEAFI